jgi:hypothetical protein
VSERGKVQGPLIADASLALTWGLVRAGGSGWGDGYTVALLAGGAALLAGFVLRERVAADPMVPLRLFRSRTFTAANAAAFLQSGAIFSRSPAAALGAAAGATVRSVERNFYWSKRAGLAWVR